ncbi:uncharacterized protein LOC125941785 [Dermacentor silvarum]|uniref:uncharacterized protein LOC125941785 n=1 Tax=Dermacentor silvarum TaxID=543639 RepID=UPI002101C1F7|nr:uncharacterized protein LOC125941785 [Dermacentor silvarum]
MAASKPNANARVRFSTSDDLALLPTVLLFAYHTSLLGGASTASCTLQEIYCAPEDIQWVDLSEPPEENSINEIAAFSQDEATSRAVPNIEGDTAPELPRRHVARRKRGQISTADHAFLEKRWKHEQALKDKEVALEEKRIDLERYRLALERKRLQRESEIRMEELRVREDDRREREEQRRTNAAPQSALLESVNKLFDRLKKE